MSVTNDDDIVVSCIALGTLIGQVYCFTKSWHWWSLFCHPVAVHTVSVVRRSGLHRGCVRRWPKRGMPLHCSAASWRLTSERRWLADFELARRRFWSQRMCRLEVGRGYCLMLRWLLPMSVQSVNQSHDNLLTIVVYSKRKYWHREF